MSDRTLQNFLKELGMRLGAAVVVVGSFVGLGYANRTNLFGLSRVLNNQLAFFAIAFLLVGVASLGWVTFQQYRT